MYELGVQRTFEAQHQLVGGDWGRENEPHTHVYRLEVCIAGETLDPFGYLVDLARVESRTDELVAWLAGRSLNTLPEMAGLNPSVEHLCRICWEHLAASPEVNRCASLTVRIWENDMAWASFTRAL